MKTIFKYLLLVIISLSIIEGLGALALKIHIGKLPSLKTLYTERQAIAEIKDNYKNESKSDWNLAASNMTVHPYLGFVFNPEHNSTELSNSHAGLKITDYGNIDSESPIRKPAPNEVIVGITGGSVAFWLSAIGTKTLEKELLKSPALKDKKIVFVRLGLGGYKQPQQLMQLNYLLIQG
ncbi:MAG: hypothetical protein KDD38_00750, partial [Bdellovibrionales bacterium]|nr:hypothetical protein [Bdellovibrionales bacterium]